MPGVISNAVGILMSEGMFFDADHRAPKQQIE
jgi:hypothetical protein